MSHIAITINENSTFTSFQDELNRIANLKLGKQDFLEHINRLESDLCLFYKSKFSIKNEEKDKTLNFTVFLNDKELLTFFANF